MLRRSKESAIDESSSSASTEGVGDRKEAFVLEGCRRNRGLAGGEASLRGTCLMMTVKPRCAYDRDGHEDEMKPEV